MIPIGDLLLDTESQSLIKNQAVISLTYTEYRILELMAKHRKKIYSLDNIYQSVWGGRRCWGRCNYGTHKEYPKKNGRQFTKSEIYKNSLGKGILH